jgi:hypothetical protein
MSEATHMPPHDTSPDAHTHAPAWQVVPVPQIVPHTPQFWLSVKRATHSSPHAVSPTPRHMRGGGTVELSGAPLSPEPGALDPIPQPRTTKSADHCHESQERETAPKHVRLLTNSGTSCAPRGKRRDRMSPTGAPREMGRARFSASRTRGASLHAPPKSPTRFRARPSIAWTVPLASATR